MKNRHIGWVGRWRNQLTLGLGMLLTAAVAQAQVAIQSVSGALQSGVEVVKIDLSDVLSAPPTGFTIQSPARIALDFPNVVSAIGRSTVEVNQGNLRTVNVVQAGGRTRVVLNLKQTTTYKTQWQGKSLLVVLDPMPGQGPAPASQLFAENQNREVLPLRDLDFRRGTDGSGRVVVSLSNNQVGVDVREQGQLLVVEFMKTSLPEGLRRRLDVNDFGTPIKTITTTQFGDRVRMEIEPQGVWVHSAYQTDEQFVLEVKPVKEDPTKLTQGPGFSGQKLSLNFQSIEIRSLLQVIADFTNFNVVTSDSVTGTVTLRLQDVPWDQALDIILQAKGLGVRKTGNVLWIAPKEEIAAKEKLELESKATVLSLEPVRTQAFKLSYAKAKDVAVQLAATAAGTGTNANSSRVLSARGSAVAEPRTNQLFVTDVPSKLEEVQQMIAKLDIPVRQVLIEARIVEASDTFGRSLGVKFGSADLRAQQGGDGGYAIGGGSNRIAFGTNYGNAVASSGAGGTVDLTSGYVNLPASGYNGFSAATFALSIFSSAANRFLNLELSALESDGNGKVVSNPRIVTADQYPAKIIQGVQIPYTKAGENGGPATTEFQDANLELEVTPQITPDGSILLDVYITKDTPGALTPDGIAINTKQIKTQILVENGGTVVIGGIFTMDERDEVTKVPLLGDLPGLGHLFKSRTRSTEKQEMLVFITPKMVSEKAVR